MSVCFTCVPLLAIKCPIPLVPTCIALAAKPSAKMATRAISGEIWGWAKHIAELRLQYNTMLWS